MSAPRVIEVAVGAVIRDDGAVLLADRPAGKPYAGYWEFPGGKIEAGETVAEALARELHEELGIEVAASSPWVLYEHVYPHAHVRLNFRRVFDWGGAPQPKEGQRLRFLPRGAEPPQPLLPAAQPALRWLALPPTPLLVDAGDFGVGDVDVARDFGDEAAVLLLGSRDELARIPERVLAAAGAARVALFAAIDGIGRASPVELGPPGWAALLRGVGLRATVADAGAVEHGKAAGADFLLVDRADGDAPSWPLPIYQVSATAPTSTALQSAQRAGLHGIAWRRR